MKRAAPRRDVFMLLAVAVALLALACGEPAAIPDKPAPAAANSVAPSATTTARAAPARSPTIITTSTTEVLPPSVRFDGSDYTCESGSGDEWDCVDGSGAVVYCNGMSEPTDCSARWYPNDLARLDLVEFEGVSYACESFGQRCVAYESGPPPTSFSAAADVWCDGSECSHYDPDEWFELVDGAARYFCQDALAGFQKYDCVVAFGDQPPAIIAQPDLYCSGGEYMPDCSELWYPSDLLGETIITSGGSTYVCDQAISGDFGDYDCGTYTGGDPAFVFTGQLKCSDMAGSFECAFDEYPSALVGVYFATIGYTNHVCEDTYRGSECWSYFTGSVRNAMFGPPDYYCNHHGECEPYGYP